MRSRLYPIILLILLSVHAAAQRSAADQFQVKNKTLSIQPLMHATFVFSYDHKTVYVDPTGGSKLFDGLARPDIILITDIHGDHLDTTTLKAVIAPETKLIVPKAVADKLPSSIRKNRVNILNNGEDSNVAGIKFRAIAMYNLPETADSRHPKGRGNGYVVAVGDKNIYISGDTEDIPEMRSLKNIDIAFVCMNLPFTMDVNQAAQGVLAFKPMVVYPYHHRGQDINVFKKLVNAENDDIDVRIRNWYPEN